MSLGKGITCCVCYCTVYWGRDKTKLCLCYSTRIFV